METTMPKRLATAALRAVLLFAIFQLLSALSRLIFQANVFDDTMLSPRALGAWQTFFLLLIFESTVFALHRHREDGRQSFLASYANSGMAGILKHTFASVEMYVEWVLVVLLSLLIPQGYSAVGIALHGEGNTGTDALAVVIPLLVVLEVVAHLSVRSAWSVDAPQKKRTKSAEDKPPFAKTVGLLAFTAMVYCAASLIIPWFLPFLVTLSNFGGGADVASIVLGVIAVIAGAVLLLWGLCALRAVSKRRKFVARLKKYCADQKISLSAIRKPCLSLFAQLKGADFTLQVGDRLFACKLMGSLFQSSPMVFADTGEGIRRDVLRFFRTDFLQINTRLDFRMEEAPADCRKIVIVLPTPKQIYASVEGSSPRPADTGEIIGEYVLYNATGFFGALERGHLGECR